MKFVVTKASSYSYEKVVEINTLAELITFIEDNGQIIMSEDSIMIYDDYVE